MSFVRDVQPRALDDKASYKTLCLSCNRVTGFERLDADCIGFDRVSRDEPLASKLVTKQKTNLSTSLQFVLLLK